MRRLSIYLLTLLALSLLRTAEAQTADVPGPYRAYFEAMRSDGLTPLIPASSDFRPGYIYRLITAPDGTVVRDEVCDDAFRAEVGRRPRRLRITDIASSSHTFSDDALNAALHISPATVGERVIGAIGAHAGDVQTVDLTFDGMREFEVLDAGDRRRLEQGEFVDQVINASCRGNLRRLERTDAEFSEKVFLVVRAAAPRSFRYSLAGEGDALINLRSNVEGLGETGAGWRTRWVDDRSFEIVRAEAEADVPETYVAAQIVRLGNVTRPPTVASSRSGRIRPRPATAEDFIQAATAPRAEPTPPESAPTAHPADTPATPPPTPGH